MKDVIYTDDFDIYKAMGELMEYIDTDERQLLEYYYGGKIDISGNELDKNKIIKALDKMDIDIYDYFNSAIEMEQTILCDDLKNLGDNEFIAIGSVGRWNGTVYGKKLLHGKDLTSIFELLEDSFELYSDGYNIHFVTYHHDGTNHFIIRMFKNVTDEQKETFLNTKTTKSKTSKYTVSVLPYFNYIFGCTCYQRVMDAFNKEYCL